MNTLLSTMQPEELRQIMADLHCSTYRELADEIGVSKHSIYGWLSGRNAIPRTTAMLLRMLVCEQERIAA